MAPEGPLDAVVPKELLWEGSHNTRPSRGQVSRSGVGELSAPGTEGLSE